jgi:hypothetical protein
MKRISRCAGLNRITSASSNTETAIQVASSHRRASKEARDAKCYTKAPPGVGKLHDDHEYSWCSRHIRLDVIERLRENTYRHASAPVVARNPAQLGAPLPVSEPEPVAWSDAGLGKDGLGDQSNQESVYASADRCG